ncbi:hypothetical protein [Natronincola ferrireducens]|nr:hypothetical protein [Natronincola ferrireducens]
MGQIQALILVPDDFIMWAVGDSIPTLALFLFMMIAYPVINFTHIKKDQTFLKASNLVKRHKKVSITAFLGVAMIIGYYMFTNASVISSDKIVTHGFFYPQGKEYSYSDIKALHTGTYNRTIPFIRDKGEFYYIIELNNGKKINLANIGGVKDHRDSWLTFMELDQVFTELDVVKNVDAKNFDSHLKNLDPLYRGRIQNIFENVK